MVMSTVTKMAWSILLLTCLFSIATAQTDVISPSDGLPQELSDSSMKLSLRPSDSAPVAEDYKVAPLTTTAGLGRAAYDGDPGQNMVRGNIIPVDQSNYNSVNSSDTIAFMTCDTDGGNDSYIRPTDMFQALIERDIKTILLYSLDNDFCSLAADSFDTYAIWTMTIKQEASKAKSTIEASTEDMVATIGADGGSGGTDSFSPARPDGGSNSAVAMSILYSITGIITLLFLIIIGSGAIRAHRHPERYGPRPGYGGRPRQSRAKGLARAVLDTIPIVKFGDSRPSKPDPEHELESTSGDRHPTNSPTPDEAPAESTREQDVPPEANIASKSASEAVAPATSRENQSSAEGDTDEHMGCSICTEDFTVGENVRVLPCDHKFHPQCVDPWLVNVSGTCPLCRLDLRPQSAAEGEASSVPASRDGAEVDGHLAPIEADTADMNANQRRRRSRLTDWNRLRHASVDERIQALRQYRQSEQAAASASGPRPADDQTRHPKLADRLREKFHIRTRTQAQLSSDEPNSNAPPAAAEGSRTQ